MDLSAPLTLYWQITNKCNLSCLHCLENSGPGIDISKELGRREVEKLLAKIIKAQIPYVIICGGEPLLHPDFELVCDRLSAAGVSVKIETNGHFLDTAMAQKFKNWQVRSVQVSLDGAKLWEYKRLRPTGSWSKVINACKSLKKAGVPFEVTFAPTRFNIDQAGKSIDLARLLGAFQFNTGKMIKIGRAVKTWNRISLSSVQYDRFRSYLRKKAGTLKGRMRINCEPFDIADALKNDIKHMPSTLILEPDGKVKISGMLPFSCGDLKKESIEKVWGRFKKMWRSGKVIERIRAMMNDES
ncbi:radical SAM protein [Elusimicrobiota bacterium]